MDYKNINENALNVINNEFDYSNIIPTVEGITFLIQYIYSEYERFLALLLEDEKNNEPLKPEFKHYNYKKCYAERFSVCIRKKTYDYITCNDFPTFQSAVKSGNLINIASLEILMELDFKRGIGNDLKEHNNSFKIVFKPYAITFVRKSNHNEIRMSQIENNINSILKQFNVANSIFCTK